VTGTWLALSFAGFTVLPREKSASHLTTKGQICDLPYLKLVKPGLLWVFARGAEQKGQANLDGVVKAARVQTGEGGNFIKPVAQGIAVNRKLFGRRGRAAIFSKENR
jgi:hypothetical protein